MFTCILLALSLCFLFSSARVSAYEHAYERTTDYIYAVARHGMTVYNEPGGDVVDYIPDFEGVVAIGEDGSWYEVRYRKKKKTRYGYVTKDEFEGSGLEYDGRDKQIIADGKYRMYIYGVHVDDADPFSDMTINSSSMTNLTGTYTFTYVGDNGFCIRRDSEKDFLSITEPEDGSEPYLCWSKKDHAGTFVLIRDENIYRIVEQSTKKYVVMDQSGSLTLSGDSTKNVTCWRILRTRKALWDGVLRNFCQYDPDWAHYRYGGDSKEKVETGNYSTSGCGVLATFNAIYAVSGQLPDVFELGNYAIEERYRIEGAGTDSDFFKAVAKEFGYKYGIAYDGSDASFKSLREKLGEGCVAIVYLPGHYGTIVSYNSKKDKYLLLDSHKIIRRATSEWGDWVSEEDLSNGDLYSEAFFYYRRIDDEK